MDTPKIKGANVQFVRGHDGVINFMRLKSLVLGKKLWIPVIGRKQLHRMFSSKRNADIYARLVIMRYQRLLKCKEEQDEN